MAVKIVQPKEETSMGRRLLAMAAPIVGGATGGVGGAILGSVVGGKLSGQSGADAALNGISAGANQYAQAPKEDAPAPATTAGAELNGSVNLQQPQIGDSSAFGRRANALSQNPEVAIQEGLNVLSSIPKGHPLDQYTEPLVRAQMKYGRSV